MKKRKYAPADFTFDNLPQTRKEQFFDFLKHRFMLLFKIGLILLLFCLPLLVVHTISENIFTNLYNEFQASTITNDEYAYYVFIVSLIRGGLVFVSLLIISLCLAGVGKILRQLIWDEPIFFWHDFKNGIHDNWKAFIVNFSIIGLIYFVCSLSTAFFGLWNFFSLIGIVVAIFVFLPIAFVNISYAPIYMCGPLKSYGNSSIIYVSSKLKVLLITVFYLVPVCSLLIPFQFVTTVVFAAFVLLVYPIILLASDLIMYGVFDNKINSAEYKEIYRKGLYNKSTK